MESQNINFLRRDQWTLHSCQTNSFSQQITNAALTGDKRKAMTGLLSVLQTCARPRSETVNESVTLTRTGTWRETASLGLPPLCSETLTLGLSRLVAIWTWSVIGIALWTLSVASACTFHPLCSGSSLVHTNVHEILEDSPTVCAGDRTKGYAIGIVRNCGCVTFCADCRGRSHRTEKICLESASPLLSSDLVFFCLPVQTGFQSAVHKPTSCPGCGEHPLHRVHLQTVCMQILLIDVYRSQVGCRHLLSAHSGQTHAANPQAGTHPRCS